MQMSKEIEHEALRIASRIVLKAIVDQGYRTRWVSPAQVREAGRELLRCDPQPIINQAWNVCKIRYEARRAP
jgi:hypothetical protein